MIEFSAAEIRSLNDALAANLLATLDRRPDLFLSEEEIAAGLRRALFAGTAALLGQWSVLGNGEDDVAGAAAGFLGHRPAGRALVPFLRGAPFDPYPLVEQFEALHDGNPPLPTSIFVFGLAALLAAFAAALRGETPLREALRLSVDLESLPPWFPDEMADFAAAVSAEGLGQIVDGEALAADGETILHRWHAGEEAAMAEPPEAEYPGEAMGGGPDTPPDDLLGESAGTDEPSGGGPTEFPAPVLPPEPVQPPGSPSGERIVALRLDAALPDPVTVGEPFDLAVSIRQAESPPLVVEDLARRESAPFAALWPEDALAVQMRLEVAAPECIIHGQASQQVRVYAGRDTPPVYFQLTPQETGVISIVVTVFQEADYIGAARLRTQSADEARGALAVRVESQPVGGPRLSPQALRDALVAGYNDSELRDLCFDLAVDYEELPGATKSDKARDLVLYVQRRGTLADLVDRVRADRPHLFSA